MAASAVIRSPTAFVGLLLFLCRSTMASWSLLSVRSFREVGPSIIFLNLTDSASDRKIPVTDGYVQTRQSRRLSYLPMFEPRPWPYDHILPVGG